MNETVISRLEELKQSYEELNLEIAQPEVIQDMARYQKLAKRHAELGQIVDSYQRFQDVERGIADTRELLEESDPEMKALA